MESSFGQYLRTLREERKYSLSELAKLIDINATNLSKIERGARDFDMKRLSKLCEIFSLDYKSMEEELFSEKIAKKICENNYDSSILKLAEQKKNISLMGKKIYQM